MPMTTSTLAPADGRPLYSVTMRMSEGSVAEVCDDAAQATALFDRLRARFPGAHLELRDGDRLIELTQPQAF